MVISLPPFPWLVPGRQRGLDVSVAQRPNAALMRAAKAAGCISCDIKACDFDTTRGVPFMDPACLQHLQFARGEGLFTGTYAFFKSGAPWQPQAEQYVRTFDMSGPLSMRPTIDWEDQDAIRKNPQKALDGVLQWAAYVHARTGRRPMIYTGPAVIAILLAAKLDLRPLLQYTLWQAQYRWDPKTGHDYGLVKPTPIVIAGQEWPAEAWQVGGDGAPHLPGLTFATDIDIYFFPSVEAYIRWCADDGVIVPTPPPPPMPTFDLMTSKGIQGALTALGYAPGPIDGVLGPRSVLAIRLFQTQHGLVGDGIVGPKTRAALAAALATRTADATQRTGAVVPPAIEAPVDTPWATPRGRTKSSGRMPAVVAPTEPAPPPEPEEDGPDTEKP